MCVVFCWGSEGGQYSPWCIFPNHRWLCHQGQVLRETGVWDRERMRKERGSRQGGRERELSVCEIEKGNDTKLDIRRLDFE